MVGFDISYDSIRRAGMVENHPWYNCIHIQRIIPHTSCLGASLFSNWRTSKHLSSVVAGDHYFITVTHKSFRYKCGYEWEIKSKYGLIDKEMTRSWQEAKHELIHIDSCVLRSLYINWLVLKYCCQFQRNLYLDNIPRSYQNICEMTAVADEVVAPLQLLKRSSEEIFGDLDPNDLKNQALQSLLEVCIIFALLRVESGWDGTIIMCGFLKIGQ